MPEPAHTTSDYLKRLGPASVLAGGALVLPPLGSIALLYYINDIGQWLRGHEGAGVVIYAACFAVLAGVALLPTYASAILGGWAFGFATGLPAALCGFLGGAAIGYGVARPVSAARVTSLIEEKPQWKAVRDALVGGTWGKTLAIVTLLRLPPNSPFALTNLVLASVRVPLWIYLLGTLLGMTPRTALVLYIASTVSDKLAQDAAKDRPVWLIVVMIVTSVLVLGVIGMVAKRALKRVTGEASPSVPNGGGGSP